jgi:hypothetical protein
MAAPRVRGVHGLPGRPWFGRALVDHTAWLVRNGRSSGGSPDGDGTGPG